MKRFFDLVVSILLLAISALPFILLSILISSTSKGPSLYWSKRIGKENQIFYMPKFRTMILNVPEVATHLLEDPASYYTPVGNEFQRSTLPTGITPCFCPSRISPDPPHPDPPVKMCATPAQTLFHFSNISYKFQ